MGHDIDSAAERAYTAAIRDHAARLIDGSEAYPFDCDDYCAVVELCDDHDAALDRLEAMEAERDRAIAERERLRDICGLAALDLLTGTPGDYVAGMLRLLSDPAKDANAHRGGADAARGGDDG